MADDERKVLAPLYDLNRFSIRPTDEKLQRDAAVLADRLHNVWDGEVECMVVFIRRGSNQAIHASTFGSTDRKRAVLSAILKSDTKIVTPAMPPNKKI